MSSIQAILDRQLRRWELERSARESRTASAPPGPPMHPVITISRERGSGGSQVAEMLARRLDYTLLHRDVIDRICQSSGMRRNIVEALDTHARSQFATWWEAIIAQRYADASDYVRWLLETVYSVAELGGAVVVGRGANFIIGPERGLHARIVAPREQRIARLVDHARLSRREAAREIEQRDHERAEFVRRVHGHDIADPAGYDLVLNTGALTFEAAVALLVEAARAKFAGALPAAGAPVG